MSAPGDHASLHAQPWFHTIDLPDGTATPGVFDTRASSARLDWPDLKGARCLDVGTCDGFWAFEMERRGAGEVIAIDVDDPAALDLPKGVRESNSRAFLESAARRRARFELAASALGSRARRVSCSVLDLDPAVHGTFDLVFCGTLLIHVREPVRALERMAGVCRGDLLLVETVDARLDLLRGSTPCARFEPAPWQWWRANTAGLKAMLRLAGFEVVSISPPFSTPMGAAGKSSLRGRLAALQSPLVTRVAGIALGAYDISMRARPVTSARG
jgi:tRNA (mo5U34)-methyltransferase